MAFTASETTAEVRLAKKYRVPLLVFAVLLIAAPLLLRPFVHDKLEEITVHVPEFKRPPERVRLDQNWSPAQRAIFHHTPQGTRLVPYEWFKALEQPCLSPFGCEKFADPAYLDRFGFLPSEADAQMNPDGLPVGFAVDREFVDPITKNSLSGGRAHLRSLPYQRALLR